MSGYLTFFRRAFQVSFSGNRRFQLWMALLAVVGFLGLHAYARQLVDGLAVTGMSDPVPWGAYISNFAFLVAIAAGAVLVVFPIRFDASREARILVHLAELVALVALTAALLFVFVDIGRPERFLNTLRRPHLPESMLSWDVVELGGFGVLLSLLVALTIRAAVTRRRPSAVLAGGVVLATTLWAVIVPVGDALLFTECHARPLWDSVLVVPRFLAASLAAGAGFMILFASTLRFLRVLDVPHPPLQRLLQLLRRALAIVVILLLVEAVLEARAEHVPGASWTETILDWRGGDTIAIGAAAGIGLLGASLVALYLPLGHLGRRRALRDLFCATMLIGLWLEKSAGFVVPGFTPSTLGEPVRYLPTLHEVLVCVGIGAFGLFALTLCARVTTLVTFEPSILEEESR